MKFVPKSNTNHHRLRGNFREINNQKMRTDTQGVIKDQSKKGRIGGKVEEGEVKRRKDYLTQVESLWMRERLPKVAFLRKANKKNAIDDGSFHEAVGSVFLLAQFFSFMPVKGVSSKIPSQLSFSWSNLRTWYSLLCISVFAFDWALRVKHVLHHSITFNSVEPAIFAGCGLFVSIAALKLAVKWPDLMMKWYEAEKDLPPLQCHRSLSFRIKMMTIVVMMLSLGEWITFLVSTSYFSRACYNTGDPFMDFFLIRNAHLINTLPYSFWLGVASIVKNFLDTFIWTYMDVFLVIISIGLSTNFERLNNNLSKFKSMQMPEDFWSERRIQYRNLGIVCEDIDNAISVITMISYSNNLYYICVQLLKSLNKMPNAIHAVYFYYSLLFLLGRAIAVSLFTAEVHEASRKPLRILRWVPKESWRTEVKRFLEEVESDFVALSGMKFFHLTRKLILSVAGTVVTYELVLIQFYENFEIKMCAQFNNNSLTIYSNLTE